MAWSGWLTPSEVVEAPYWPTCDLDDLEVLVLLISSQNQCEEFAPAVEFAAGVTGATVLESDEDDVPTEAVVPESWRLAQALQARALYRSGVAGSGDRVGGDDLAVTVFPMDWTVKNLLRPRAGRPRVG